VDEELKEAIRKDLKGLGGYLLAFGKWVLASVVLGLGCGAVGAFFHLAIDVVTEFRMEHAAIIWLLPAAGALTLLLYKLCRVGYGVGTNLILQTAEGEGHVPILLAPLIFAGTLLSHLFGASVGREGAALQLGGSLGCNFGTALHFDKEDTEVLTMCGMSACFAALFGTPLTASVFVLEVLRVGSMRYNALLPCVLSAYTAAFEAKLIGTEPMAFELAGVPGFGPVPALQAAGLAALCAVAGIVFCTCIHRAGHLLEHAIPNPYLRIAAGGAIVAIAAPLFGLYDFTGAGGHMITAAIAGDAPWYAFIVKMLLTALCVGAGFRGGEIVPTLFIGSTFGCIASPLFGLEAGFGAAVGLTALFCSVVNCPLASVFLAIELFSPGDVSMFVVAVAVAYVLSGYFGLYGSQKIVFSKVRQKVIEITAQ